MAEKDLIVDEKGEVITPTEQKPEGQGEGQQTEGQQGEGQQTEGQQGEGQQGEGQSTEDEDRELSNEEVDAEREAIRARRREERKHKKEAQRDREDTLKRELSSRDHIINDLTTRLSVIERKSSGMELTTIDNHINQSKEAYDYFKNQIAVASAAGNHQAIADATEKMIMARDKFNQLTNVKTQYQRQQQQQPPLDPRMTTHANAWLTKNSWYDPNKSDEDSEVASVIDRRLAAEGWNPTTPEYWQELDVRLKKRLPHRYNSGYNTTSVGTPRSPRAPVAGSGREGTSSNSSQSYKLSADRVSALRDAGIYPGTPEFVESVKRYKDYDKQQSAAGQ